MKALQLIPELLVENMPKTIQFYEDVLGFKTEIAFPEKKPVFVQIVRDNVRIMLYVRSEFENEIPLLKGMNMGGSVLLYIKVDKLEPFYQKIKEKVTIVQTLHKTAYGMLECTIEDCNGYIIVFSERISDTK